MSLSIFARVKENKEKQKLTQWLILDRILYWEKRFYKGKCSFNLEKVEYGLYIR